MSFLNKILDSFIKNRVKIIILIIVASVSFTACQANDDLQIDNSKNSYDRIDKREFYDKYSSWDVIVKKVNTIKDAIEEEKHEIDYKNFLSIKMKETELEIEKPQFTSEKSSSAFYKFEIENISNKAIEVWYSFFISDRIISNDIVLEGAASVSNRTYNLEPGQKISASANTLIKHYENKLTDSQREIFDDEKNYLYFEFVINGKKAYLEATSLIN